MKKVISNSIGIYLTLFLLTIASYTAKAVAFKVENSTSYLIRVKVYDRGEWRKYVQVKPGECKVVASSVERTRHDVVIQMLTEEGWKTMYSKNHGSRVFTRLVHLTEYDNRFYFTWWDEPPSCRDCPSQTGCLRPSGWINKIKDAYKVGQFLGKLVMLAGG